MSLPGASFKVFNLSTDQVKAGEFSFEHFSSVAARNSPPRGISRSQFWETVARCFPADQHVSVRWVNLLRFRTLIYLGSEICPNLQSIAIFNCKFGSSGKWAQNRTNGNQMWSRGIWPRTVGSISPRRYSRWESLKRYILNSQTNNSYENMLGRGGVVRTLYRKV